MSTEQSTSATTNAQSEPAIETPDTRPPIVRRMWPREKAERWRAPVQPFTICPGKDETYRDTVGARYVFSMGVIRGSERTMLVEALSRAVEEYRWAEAFFLADRLDEITGRGDVIEAQRAEREHLRNVVPPWERPDDRAAPPDQTPPVSDESRRIAAIIEEKRRRWRGCA